MLGSQFAYIVIFFPAYLHQFVDITCTIGDRLRNERSLQGKLEGLLNKVSILR